VPEASRPIETEEERRQRDAEERLETRPAELEPTSFEEGFTIKTVLGALFVGFIMMPGAIYLGLVVGQELGPAAEWTTIILFTEVARRSFTSLRRQEIYMIFYMAGALAGGGAGLALAGGPFANLIWAQYVRQSPVVENFGLTHALPTWWAPPMGSAALAQRTFFHPDWAIPILLLVIYSILNRMEWLGLGYILFRMTSDTERLPFPFAPIAAQGATALAEVSQEKETWKWPVFSVGTMIGIVYGSIYVFIPVLSGAVLTEPIMLIKIPFLDFTSNAEGVFPTGKIGLGTELGSVLVGMVVPYPIVVGSFITSIFTNFVFSPTLYHVTGGAGGTLFHNWKPGMSLIQTEISTSVDLWLSVGAGVNLAIAVLGFYAMFSAIARRVRGGERERMKTQIPPGRGDYPMWAALASWLFAATCYTIIAHILVNVVPHKRPEDQFPIWILVFFGLIWSPLNSYVSARLIGLTGRPVGIPYLREATFILSKYRGVDIWLAPIPLTDLGGQAQRFREIELTGTKFISVVKAEVFLFGLLLSCSFIFWWFFWRLGPIPSSAYPYAQTWWPVRVFERALWWTATREDNPWLLRAIKPSVIGSAFGGAFLLYAILGAFRVPVMWFYGLIGGFGANTVGVIPLFAGAMLGRYYFARRFGMHRWQQYTPVLVAGYACGTGLVGMTGIALAIVLKSVRLLPY
jgi:hypothetical protein